MSPAITVLAAIVTAVVLALTGCVMRAEYRDSQNVGLLVLFGLLGLTTVLRILGT